MRPHFIPRFGRGRHPRNLSAVAFIAAAATALAACGSSSTHAKTQSKSILTVAEAVAPTTLDPQASSLGADWDAWQLSYQCLLTQSSTGAIVPQLATSYSVDSSGTTYTFQLRHGVQFQNGDPFTAADVVYTFNRLTQSGIPYTRGLFSTIQTVKAVGNYEVQFALTTPDANFLPNMASPSVVGCAILDSNAKVNLALNMVGTGPYKMVSYQPNDSLTLTAFAHYWGPAPANTGLDILYVPNALTAVSDLQSGKVDLIFPSPSTVSGLTSNPAIKLQSVIADNVDEIDINTSTAPFDNVLVRRAIALAINRQQIVELAYDGNAEPTSYLPPGFSWGVPLSKQPYSATDVAQAKSLLAQAGYPNGFTTTLMYIAGYSPQATQEVTVLASQLGQIGVKVTLSPLETAAWNTALNKPSYDLSWNYYGYFANPALYLTPRAGRQGPTPNSVASLISSLPNAKTQTSYQAAINAIATEEANQVFPDIPLVAPKSYVAYRSSLTGVNLPPSLVRSFLANVG